MQNSDTWQEGCGTCEYGLLGDVKRGRKVDVPLYMFRVFQAQKKLVTFCECRAGAMQRKYLLRVWKDIQEGRDPITPSYVEKIELALLGNDDVKLVRNDKAEPAGWYAYEPPADVSVDAEVAA